MQVHSAHPQPRSSNYSIDKKPAEKDCQQSADTPVETGYPQGIGNQAFGSEYRLISTTIKKILIISELGVRKTNTWPLESLTPYPLIFSKSFGQEP